MQGTHLHLLPSDAHEEHHLPAPALQRDCQDSKTHNCNHVSNPEGTHRSLVVADRAMARSEDGLTFRCCVSQSEQKPAAELLGKDGDAQRGWGIQELPPADLQHLRPIQP